MPTMACIDCDEFVAEADSWQAMLVEMMKHYFEAHHDIPSPYQVHMTNRRLSHHAHRGRRDPLGHCHDLTHLSPVHIEAQHHARSVGAVDAAGPQRLVDPLSRAICGEHRREPTVPLKMRHTWMPIMTIGAAQEAEYVPLSQLVAYVVSVDRPIDPPR